MSHSAKWNCSIYMGCHYSNRTRIPVHLATVTVVIVFLLVSPIFPWNCHISSLSISFLTAPFAVRVFARCVCHGICVARKGWWCKPFFFVSPSRPKCKQFRSFDYISVCLRVQRSILCTQSFPRKRLGITSCAQCRCLFVYSLSLWSRSTCSALSMRCNVAIQLSLWRQKFARYLELKEFNGADWKLDQKNGWRQAKKNARKSRAVDRI